MHVEAPGVWLRSTEMSGSSCDAPSGKYLAIFLLHVRTIPRFCTNDCFRTIGTVRKLPTVFRGGVFRNVYIYGAARSRKKYKHDSLPAERACLGSAGGRV
jgi:hypothetical protein